ncbi:MAG: hypothetical protein EBY44_10400 [Actinobacteria bacterium]|nr:hypothetical protein [Actinomycetota bacterium]
MIHLRQPDLILQILLPLMVPSKAFLTKMKKHGRSNLFKHDPAMHDDEVTLFKSAGTALEDLAAARLAVG